MHDLEKTPPPQTLRETPAKWREHILRAPHTLAPEKRIFVSALKEHITALLWSHPKVCAELPPFWIFIFAAHLDTSGHRPRVARATLLPSAEYWQGAREQKLFLTLLMYPNPPAPRAYRPDLAAPRPRSISIVNIRPRFLFCG